MADSSGERSHGRLVARLGVVVITMFGFGFALVPLYEAFCDITGLNGKTGRVDAAEAVQAPIDESRSITVEFVAHVSSELPWEFRPVQTKMVVHPGQVAEAKYYAANRTDAPVSGQAIPSVVPGKAAKYFNKTECFCFSKQTLAAGEEREMVLRFVVDTDLPAEVGSIALSYTFFESKDS